eukprot:g42214.t1
MSLQVTAQDKFHPNPIHKLVVVGRISNNDESEYGKEIECSVSCCKDNRLSFKVSKTKELIINLKKKGRGHISIHTNGVEVERVESIKFLGVTITNNLSWSSRIDETVKKAQRCLFFLRRFRKFGMSLRTLTNFYRCTIESILSGCTVAWYGNCSAQNCKKLQKAVNTAQTIIQANLPSMNSIYSSRCRGKAASIVKDPSHP